MPEDISKLTKAQISSRIADKTSIIGMLEVELEREKREIKKLKTRPHTTTTKPFREETLQDYTKLPLPKLQDKKTILSKELMKVMGLQSEVKVKLRMVDGLIVKRLKG